MAEHGTAVRDVAALKVARVGRVEETDDPLLPVRLLDGADVEVPPVSEFLHHMLADDAIRSDDTTSAEERVAVNNGLRVDHRGHTWLPRSRTESGSGAEALSAIAVRLKFSRLTALPGPRP